MEIFYHLSFGERRQLDEKSVSLKAGDVLVQRGGMHTWLNKGAVPAVMAAVLIDATPVEVAGKIMNTHYPE
jgi:hypothetical protein